jgi:flavin-dependent dehydrogenase
MVSVPEYDLVVIGSGPAGQKGALAAAKLGKHVAVVDRTMISGVCVPTGTISSKDVRTAIFQLTGSMVKTPFGNGKSSCGDSKERLFYKIENGAHRRSVHERFVGRKPCSVSESQKASD